MRERDLKVDTIKEWNKIVGIGIDVPCSPVVGLSDKDQFAEVNTPKSITKISLWMWIDPTIQ